MTTIGMTVGSGSVQNTTYSCVTGGHGTNSTTGLVQTITQFGTTLTYAYDNVGNITSVSDGSKTVSYVYDKLGQLTRANDPYDTTAGSTGTTWVYAYDQGGNILSKTAYAYTTGTVGTVVKTDSYTYGDSNWKDKLTAYNGTTIAYDAIGNPTSDGTWTYVWEKGRQLKKMVKSGETATFTYNADGLRVKKVCTTTGTTNYTLHGKNVVHLNNNGNDLHFFYDAQNRPAIVVFNGTAYGYVHNLQGDIIAIVNSSGTKVVEYAYDAWGKLIAKTGSLATTLGALNPFRYRGYIYDEETGLYYLRSRYYRVGCCRFVSSDSPNLAGIDVKNMYCYCNNNTITAADPDGDIVEPGKGFHPIDASDTEWYYRIDDGGGVPIHIHVIQFARNRIIQEFCEEADGTQHHKSIPVPNEKARKMMKKDNKINKKWPPQNPSSGGKRFSPTSVDQESTSKTSNNNYMTALPYQLPFSMPSPAPSSFSVPINTFQPFAFPFMIDIQPLLQIIRGGGEETMETCYAY